MYSTTQAANIAAFAGVLVMIVKTIFHKDIAADDIVTIIGAGVSVVSIIASYVHRFKKGDLTVGGFRKSYIEE